MRAFCLVVLFAGAAQAAELCVSWQLPTQNVDDAGVKAPLAMTAIQETRIEHARCPAGTFPAAAEGTAVRAAPDTNACISGLLASTQYCFRGATVRTDGVSSVKVVNGVTTGYSNVVAKTTAALPTTPLPPTLTTVSMTAWELQRQPSGLYKMAVVGTVPLGAECLSRQVKPYRELNRSAVTVTSDAYTGGILWGKCKWS
jgi:hypothetical protein